MKLLSRKPSPFAKHAAIALLLTALAGCAVVERFQEDITDVAKLEKEAKGKPDDETSVVVVTTKMIEADDEIRPDALRETRIETSSVPDEALPSKEGVVGHFAELRLPPNHIVCQFHLELQDKAIGTHYAVYLAKRDIPAHTVLGEEDFDTVYRKGKFDERRRPFDFEAAVPIRKGQEIEQKMVGIEWRDVLFAKQEIKKGSDLKGSMFTTKKVKAKGMENAFGQDTSDPPQWKDEVAARDIHKGAPFTENDWTYKEDERDLLKLESEAKNSNLETDWIVATKVPVKAQTPFKPDLHRQARIPARSCKESDVRYTSVPDGQCIPVFKMDVPANHIVSSHDFDWPTVNQTKP